MQTKSGTTDRKVTVQGCLERDASATTSAANPSFTLTHVDIIKDEAASAGAATTGTAGAGTTAASGTAAGAQSQQKEKDKDIELRIASAANAKLNLDTNVDHQVELVGTMSAKDLESARGKSASATNPQRTAGGQAGTMTTPALTLKATSIRSIADKCR
jgi:hypothetical protein